MAISPVQKYMQLAFSMMLTNRSGTDEFYSLPDDMRKYQDLKIKDSSIQSFTLAGGEQHLVNQFDADEALTFVFGSHPFSVTRFNGLTLGTSQRVFTTFIGFARDRTGDSNLQASNIIGIFNDLHTPDFISDSGGATEAMEVVVIQIAFES
jgi:hypothetical protein